MVRRLVLVIIVIALVSVPAHAQLAVIDPANLAQAVLIAQRAQLHYEELQAQYRTILRMSQGLGNMEGYRIPTISTTGHDVSRWLYGQPWLQGLNSGDDGRRMGRGPAACLRRCRRSSRAPRAARWSGNTRRSSSPTPSR